MKIEKLSGVYVSVVFPVSRPVRNGCFSYTQLSSISNAKPAWEYGDIYIIKDEVKFAEYDDGSIFFFPKHAYVDSKSPIGRAARHVKTVG